MNKPKNSEDAAKHIIKVLFPGTPYPLQSPAAQKVIEYMKERDKYLHHQLQKVREETIEEIKDSVLGIIVKNSTGFDTVGNARTWHVDIDAVEKDLSTLNK